MSNGVRRAGTQGPSSAHEQQHTHETQHAHETDHTAAQNVAETEAAQRAAQAQQTQQTRNAEAGQNQNTVASPEEAGRRRLERGIEGTARQVQLNTELGQQGYMSMDGIDRTSAPPESPQTVDITQDPAFQALPDDTRTRMLNEVRQDPNASGQLQQVVNHPQYDDLSTQQRTQLLNVFANSDQNGRQALPTLMGRQVQTGSGNPPQMGPALLSPDNTANRTTLLENLDRLSTQPMRPDLENRRGEVLGRVIHETAEPSWEVDQGRSATCIEASVQHHVMRNNPSEYARIIGGLSSPERAVTLADGSRMEAAQNDTGNTITHWNRGDVREDARGITGRMFQSALRQHGNRAPESEGGLGPGFTEDANNELQGRPLQPGGVQRVMGGIYDRQFQTTGELGRDPQAQQETHTQIQQELNNGNGPVLTGLHWGGQGDEPGHMVAVERIENGRVYFRNPWGSSDNQGNAGPYHDGMERHSPPTRVEDAQSGLESMSEDDFRRDLQSAHFGPPA